MTGIIHRRQPTWRRRRSSSGSRGEASGMTGLLFTWSVSVERLQHPDEWGRIVSEFLEPTNENLNRRGFLAAKFLLRTCILVKKKKREKRKARKRKMVRVGKNSHLPKVVARRHLFIVLYSSSHELKVRPDARVIITISSLKNFDARIKKGKYL
jgi:hypothetical protein